MNSSALVLRTSERGCCCAISACGVCCVPANGVELLSRRFWVSRKGGVCFLPLGADTRHTLALGSDVLILRSVERGRERERKGGRQQHDSTFTWFFVKALSLLLERGCIEWPLFFYRYYAHICTLLCLCAGGCSRFRRGELVFCCLSHACRI